MPAFLFWTIDLFCGYINTMFSFKVTKKSEKSRARLGIISTPHGEVETPAFVPVATRASVRTLTSETAAELGSQLLICNTYHLHLTGAEKAVAKAGGLHTFMKWDRPLMTDSGGFQVLSMGFGREHSTGAVKHQLKGQSIKENDTPKSIKITEEGVEFRSPINGDRLFIGPKESMQIQEALGADMIFAFDEATSPLSEKAYMRKSLERTHRWAKQCLEYKTRADQALMGIVQGSEFNDMREESARLIGALPFQGFGIGGEYGIDKEAMEKRVALVTALLPEDKPRHLLGVGHPEDFSFAIAGGADTFDCIAPTHYARHGTAFTSTGRVDMNKTERLNEHEPLDAHCGCPICTTYSRAYIAHLMRAKEISAMTFLTMHNLHYFNMLAKRMRDSIVAGDL